MDEENDLLNESYESMTQVDPLSLLLSVKTSNHVYVKSDEYAWVPARLLESDGEKATVSIPHYRDEQAIQSDGGRGSKTSSKVVVELKDYPTRALYLQNVDEEGNLREVEDMVDLPFLHEVSIARSSSFRGTEPLFSRRLSIRLQFCTTSSFATSKGNPTRGPVTLSLHATLINGTITCIQIKFVTNTPRL
jgi:hypothetical protein